MNRRTFLVASLALVAGCRNSPSLSGEAIVYVVGPMSGDQADGGQSMAGGVRLRADEINQAGGLLGGKRVTVRALNDEADEEVAAAIAKQIEGAVRSGDTVLGVIGHYNSGPTAAALPTYRALNLPVVTPSATNPELTRVGATTFFRVCATDATQGPTAARHLIDQGKRTIAIAYTDNTYGAGLAREFAEGLAKAGGRVASEVRLRTGAPTFASEIAGLRGAEAIFFAGDFPDGITFVREIRKAGSTATILASDANFVDQFIDELGSASEGVLLSTIAPDPRVVAKKEWVQAYQKLEHRNPGIDSTTGYSAMEVLLGGVQKANRPEGRAVADSIRGLDLNALIGRIRYDQNGDLVDQRVFIFKVDGGRFVQLSRA